MKWELKFLPEAEKDIDDLDGSQRLQVKKALMKVKQNPIPANEGGYGKPLGKTNDTDLTGLSKIKLRSSGLRIVYKLIQTESSMVVVVVGAREDSEVYQMAEKRRRKYGL